MPGWLASILLDTPDTGKPVILPVEPVKRKQKPLGLILTFKQRQTLIHPTRLKMRIKDRLKEVPEGTQFIDFTEKELNEMQEEVNEAIRFAPTAADKKALQTVAKKIKDVLGEQDLYAFTVKKPTKSGKKVAKPDTIYQLKITLRGTKPPIWRRVQTKDCSLTRLHEIIQVAMGWQFSHLYSFDVAGEGYGAPQFLDDVESDRKIKLSQIGLAGYKKFTYVYDMGDNWEHTIQIEKTVATEPKVKYPRCIDGALACPPEDCGGVWGYVDFLAAVQNPRHKEHAEMLEWAGGKFDPEAFDADRVNKQLEK
jgi:ABC-type uncharacterized transport system substrate-binding protein